MNLAIKLENDFDYNHRLVCELEDLLKDKTGSIANDITIRNTGDHWLYVDYVIDDRFIETHNVTTSSLIQGMVIGFLEANRVNCV